MALILFLEMIKPAYQAPIDKITFDKAIEMLESKGHEVSIEEIKYKNLNSRPNKKMGDKVNEYLFYSSKKNPFKDI